MNGEGWREGKAISLIIAVLIHSCFSLIMFNIFNLDVP